MEVRIGKCTFPTFAVPPHEGYYRQLAKQRQQRWKDSAFMVSAITVHLMRLADEAVMLRVEHQGRKPKAGIANVAEGPFFSLSEPEPCSTATSP